MSRPTREALNDLLIESAWVTDSINFEGDDSYEEAVREEAWIAAAIEVHRFFDFASQADLTFPSPSFSPCPDGSIDVYWRWKNRDYLFLLNVDYRDETLVFDYACRMPTRELSGTDESQADGCMECFETWLRSLPSS